MFKYHCPFQAISQRKTRCCLLCWWYHNCNHVARETHWSFMPQRFLSSSIMNTRVKKKTGSFLWLKKRKRKMNTRKGWGQGVAEEEEGTQGRILIWKCSKTTQGRIGLKRLQFLLLIEIKVFFMSKLQKQSLLGPWLILYLHHFSFFFFISSINTINYCQFLKILR